jgi:hypothetical protein
MSGCLAVAQSRKERELKIATTVCGAETPGETAARCPICDTPGKSVKPETIRNILKEDRLPDALNDYALCLSQSCDVVYFGPHIFRKDDLKVKVWFKETDPSRPICYCTGISERDILDHILRRCCKDIKDIQQHTGANTGKQCLTMNPAGT